MRTIERSTQFKKDYKKAAKSTDPSELDSRLKYIFNHLVSDRQLHHDFEIISSRRTGETIAIVMYSRISF